jgi:hypothetical protein
LSFVLVRVLSFFLSQSLKSDSFRTDLHFHLPVRGTPHPSTKRFVLERLQSAQSIQTRERSCWIPFCTLSFLSKTIMF